VIALESYYAKCAFMVMASIISYFLENREVRLARQEMIDSIRTSVEQSIANVGTTIGTDAMQSMTNLGTDLVAYLRQLPMRYGQPIAQENHAMHAIHPNAG
jgi:H2-forming N5,N10-methylenetetrahydromethanopterin dehydrogenase-like enzyme